MGGGGGGDPSAPLSVYVHLYNCSKYCHKCGDERVGKGC